MAIVVKVDSHPEVLLDRVTQAFVDAVSDTIIDAQDTAPRRTGEYAASIGALSIGMGDPLYGRAKSAVPRAGASHEERNAGQVRLSTPAAGGGHLVARIGSSLPQAGAIERGAWVKGRGPHMHAVGTLARAGTRFVEHMTARLRAAGT